MPTPKEIAAEQERLYESSSLRDDLNDSEATVLLNWGQQQVERLAKDYPEEFEAKCRFLRQMLKNINRFVGQREFNDAAGQQKYMKKVAMYLEPLGFSSVTQEGLFARLPDDPANMAGNLDAILRTLSPPSGDSGQEAGQARRTDHTPDEANET